MISDALRALLAKRTDTSAGPDGCHLWLGIMNKTRPEISHQRKHRSARRLIWEMTFGEKPHADRRVWQTCGNFQCVNPKHMRCETYEERFWSFVDKVNGPMHPHDPSLGRCWPWTGARLKGYGQFRRDGNRRVAHRIAYEYAKEPIPLDRGEVVVMHSCDHPPCCNPDHLSLGTDLTNIRDMIAKGRAPWQKKAS